MFFFRLFCLVLIAIGIYIAINPLKVMNTLRVMFILNELKDEDDFRVDFYRIRVIVGIIIISLLLLRSFLN